MFPLESWEKERQVPSEETSPESALPTYESAKSSSGVCSTTEEFGEVVEKGQLSKHRTVTMLSVVGALGEEDAIKACVTRAQAYY